MKLNNKATTLVEVVVCFTLASILALGMFGVIVSLKKDSIEENNNRQMLDFKDNLLITIESDLILKGYKSSEDCSTTNVICSKLNFANAEQKEIKIDLNNQIIYYDNIKHEIPNKELINFKRAEVKVKEENNNLVIDIPYSYKDKTNKTKIGLSITHPLTFKYTSGSYKIEVKSNNGGILIPETANNLDEIKFTTHASDNYYYDGADLTYDNGKKIHLSQDEKTFTMESSNLLLEPIFKQK